ncbi:hypothetical protein L7F22_006361 [Adiantum nelumboides]|nr:hypothetical protein [Adiantum nelumboides]
MEHMYAQAKNKPGYAELQSKAKIIGTWDDHDYGLDDSGKELTVKNGSQKLFLDFLDEPISSTRRIQEGVYASYTFGPHDKQVKVILLDTRYHRDPMFSNGDMLGEKQWTWLEQQLRDNEAQITIIGSSIEVLPNFSATVQPLFTFEIDWDAKPVSIIERVRDVNGSYVAQEKILLSDLQPHGSANNNLESIERHCKLESDLPWFSKYLLAMVSLGILSGVSFLCLAWLYFMGGWLKKTLKAKLA